MSNLEVLVVGAGPTGMAAAIELRRAGFSVRIIDKNERMAQHSQALVVQARTLEQFQRYGIAEQAVAMGRKLHGARFYSEGKEIVSIDFDRIASRFPFLLFLPQSETEGLLNKHMEEMGVRTERGVALESLTQDANGVRVTLRHSDDREEDLRVRWVIGCDGAHSAVRRLTAIPFEGAGVGLAFILGDFEMEGPDAPGDELTLHMHRGDVIFLGRLNEKLVRMIVAVHAAPGRNESANRSEPANLTIADFQNAADRLGVRVKIRSSAWMTPFRVDDRQAIRYRIGGVFLAGDASHIHSPVGGQGMNTGIQDVANLAWKLAAVARGADESLLNTYEEERSEVGRALLRFTERGLGVATMTNPLIEAVRDRLAPIISGMKPVQKALTAFIAETGIEYRSSSAVKDAGGDGELRAGDRLPDLTLTSPSEQTTLLHDWTGAQHLVLLLNGSREEVDELSSAMPGVRLISLQSPELDDDGISLLGTRKKIVIVRPDGYVGFRGPVDQRSAWHNYARKNGLLPMVTSMAA